MPTESVTFYSLARCFFAEGQAEVQIALPPDDWKGLTLLRIMTLQRNQQITIIYKEPSIVNANMRYSVASFNIRFRFANPHTIAMLAVRLQETGVLTRFYESRKVQQYLCIASIYSTGYHNSCLSIA